MDYKDDTYTVLIVLCSIAFLAVIALCIYLLVYSKRFWKRYEAQIHYLEAQNHYLEANLEGAAKEKQIQKHRNELEIEALRETLKRETRAKDEALTRLSENISRNLTDNNPNIADLSDTNRPTNLVEQFSGLYDEEWTAAFDDLQTIPEYEDETRAILELLQIIMDCFNICREIASEQLESGLALINSNIRIENLPFEIKKLVKDTRKKKYEVDLPFVYQQIQKKFEQDRQEFFKSDNIEKYMRRCTEISWLMAIQDPPMALSTDIRDDLKFEKARYREYTKLGPCVDFVVWPAVLIQDGGHLMAKGIAQCCNEPKINQNLLSSIKIDT